MADYFVLALTVFAVNSIPLFMPPTWFVLAYALLKDPTYNPLALAVVGAISSTLGRAFLAYYSSYARQFFTKELASRADEIKRFLERTKGKLFIGTFIYSLSPFPSSMLFIAEGLTEVDPRPVFSGYFLGRLISYFTLVTLSHDLAGMLGRYVHSEATLRMIFDVVGVVAAFSIVLVDWRRVAGVKKKSIKG